MTRLGAIAVARARSAWLLLIPLLLLLLAIAGWPLGRTLWLSFTDAQLSQTEGWHFVGVVNYLGEFGVLQDSEWWNAVGNTLKFSFLSVAIETALGMAIALIINHPSKLRAALRAAMLLPWAIPTAVSSKIWSWMLHDQFGVVNYYLQALGLIAAPLAWTADADLSLISVVLVDVWKTTPFMALLMLAALQLVPVECLEAAKVDGVRSWTVFWRVTLPLIWPAIAVAIVFRLLDAMRVFDVIYIMTSNSNSTKSMSVYVREQLIDFQQVGTGSAAAIVLFLVVALITLLYSLAVRHSTSKDTA